MAEYQSFPAKIVTPEGIAFDGLVQELEVPSSAGGLGILARRSPVVADLKVGRMRALLADGTWQTWATQEGFAQASKSTATVVVEDAIRVEDIDAAAAAELVSESKVRIEAATASKDAIELHAAERALAWGEHLADMAATSR